MANHKRAIVLTGGGTGAVDKIDGAGLSAGDTIQCVNINGIYHYVNVQDSRAELSPFTIRPNTNPGTNSWHLVGTTARIGALIRLSADEVITSGSFQELDWDVAVYDDASFWAGGNPSRLTIPVGITKVKLISNTSWENIVDTSGRAHRIIQNGSTAYGLPRDIRTPKAESDVNIESAKISVAATDYFEVSIRHFYGSDLDVMAVNETWFSIEAVNFA